MAASSVSGFVTCVSGDLKKSSRKTNVSKTGFGAKDILLLSYIIQS
jgi:hypothetical protein